MTRATYRWGRRVRPLVFGTVCSGIGAPELAFARLGWRCAFMSEIDAFPRAVLQHHYPEVPLHGDFTTIQAGDYERIDALVGGTPCQSFSVAGLRGGMADDRGNLAIQFLALAGRLRPEWVVWENVPGVLSSNGGRDFGSFLGGLGELGYGWAYRTLDAQFFGVAQRRRRAFVVGHLGDWRRAAAVLFERHCLSGHPAPSREAGQRAARPIAAGSPAGSGYRNDADTADNLIAGTLNANGKAAGSATSQDAESNLLIAHPLRAQSQPSHRADSDTYIAVDTEDVAKCLSASHTASHTASGRQDPSAETYVTHSLRADGFDASEDGTGRGTPIIPVHAFDARQSDVIQYGDRTGPLDTDGHTTAICFSAKDHGADAERDLSPTLRAGGHSKSHANAGVMPAIAFGDGSASALRSASGGSSRDYVATSSVRRLTPRECERLQGFPDNFTAIPYRGKPAADGPRYKALGNSMAVPVLEWIGRRFA